MQRKLWHGVVVLCCLVACAACPISVVALSWPVLCDPGVLCHTGLAQTLGAVQVGAWALVLTKEW